MFVVQSLLLLSLSAAAKAADDGPFAALERRIGGRIGAAVLETGTGRRLVQRGAERFAMCSTFKLLLAAQILHRVDEGKETLERVIPYGSADLLRYSPVTSKRLGEGGMKIGDLCAAALRYSDNTAANLLLRTQGGPQGLTDYARSLGDGITHLDRIEPFLNSPIPGKDLDTTTPEAMAETLRRLLLGTALSPSSRRQLERWLSDGARGSARLKAGLPPSWRIVDKTGTGDNGATNDVGILYPPKGPPIVIAAYVSDAKGPRADSEAALAEVARIVVKQADANALQ